MLYLHITISTSKNVRTPSSQLPSPSQSLRSPTRYNIVPYYGRRPDTTPTRNYEANET